MDASRVLVGGFSYGAATAALVAARAEPGTFCGAMLLDGWFNIDLASISSCPDNDQYAFPALAHKVGLGGGATPGLFVGSAQFAGYDEEHS